MERMVKYRVSVLSTCVIFQSNYIHMYLGEMFRWRIKYDRSTWQLPCDHMGMLGETASWHRVVSQSRHKETQKRRKRKGVRAEAGRGRSVIDASRHFTKYKAEAYCLQVLHRRQSAGRYAGRLIGLLRPDSILRFRDGSVRGKERRSLLRVAHNNSSCCAALPLLPRLMVRQREKEKKEERKREGKRKRQGKKRERWRVQFEHSKSRWPVPTVSLLLAIRVCRVVVLPSFGSELTRSVRGVYFRSVTFSNVRLSFAAVATRRSRNPSNATFSCDLTCRHDQNVVIPNDCSVVTFSPIFPCRTINTE